MIHQREDAQDLPGFGSVTFNERLLHEASLPVPQTVLRDVIHSLVDSGKLSFVLVCGTAFHVDLFNVTCITCCVFIPDFLSTT